VPRSRAYKKNDQAFVEQKNGAVVRRLVGYGRFEGIEMAAVLARLYTAAACELLSAVVQTEGEAARGRQGHQALSAGHAVSAGAGASQGRQGDQTAACQALYRTLDPIALLAEIRAAQNLLGTRLDRRAGKGSHDAVSQTAASAVPETPAFAKALGKTTETGEPRATHRRPKRRYKTRVRMPSILDPHVATIEGWLAAEPQLTALAILGRLAERHPDQFGPPQHLIVQRLLKALRIKTAQQIIASMPSPRPPGAVDGSGYGRPDPTTAPASEVVAIGVSSSPSAHIRPAPAATDLGNIPG